MPFKLRLRERCGVHTEAHPTNPNAEVIVQPGQVFESKVNRAERWPEKFECLPETVPASADLFVRGRSGEPLATPPAAAAPPAAKTPVHAAAVAGTVEAMTVAELRKFAEEEEIKIPPAAKTRDEVLAAVKAGLGIK